MQVIAHGVDIVEVGRIERMVADHGEAFLSRVFTEAERRYCLTLRRAAIRLAGRFAAKEAVVKVLGTGWRGGISWTDIEVLPDALGKPEVKLSGVCVELAGRLGIAHITLSISHAGEYAVASAIGVGRDKGTEGHRDVGGRDEGT
jgi:holo-[acyl-carrier protein] synthase